MDTAVFKLEPFENNYEIGEDIGSGHFAVVRKCTHHKTGTAYAAKFIRKRRGGGRKGAKMEDIVKEINILRCINHPNIISLHEVYDTKMEVILVLELVAGGELFEYISEKEALSEEEASAFIKQILEGVKHLHDNNVVHLDLKPENIMLLDRNSTSIKLIDFGLARKIGDKEEVRAMMGTAEFIAPEVVSYEPLSLATDMWSIGVITYILLSGASPFLGDSQQETYHNITAMNFDFDHDLFQNTSDLAKDFIEKLFVRNPKKRATVDECLSHPWIRPKEQRETIARRSAMINIDNFKSFMARKRWKQSMRVVSLCNKLSRSMQLRKSMDTLGSRNTMSSSNTLDEETRPQDGAPWSTTSQGSQGSPDDDDPIFVGSQDGDASVSVGSQDEDATISVGSQDRDAITSTGLQDGDASISLSSQNGDASTCVGLQDGDASISAGSQDGDAAISKVSQDEGASQNEDFGCWTPTDNASDSLHEGEGT